MNMAAAAFAKRTIKFHQSAVDEIVKEIDDAIRDASDKGDFSVIIDQLTCNRNVKALVYTHLATCGYEYENHARSIGYSDGLYISWEPEGLTNIKHAF